MEFVKGLYNKYKRIISYIMMSGITAIIELITALLLINLLSFTDVSANTVGVVIGSVIHYVLVTKKVFGQTIDIKTVFIYILTFIIGLLLQNAVVYLLDRALVRYLDVNISYTISKMASLAVSFLVMYKLRSVLYSIAERKKDE
ncbi:MAG: GtrA family protein [Oribacterium sp.]|nr:GtrA family protein [Oribacterium sp.]